MAELQAAAHRCGLALKGERIDLAGVPLDRAVIAHLNRHRPDSGHFVVLRPIGNEGTVVQVIDPPYAPAVVGYHDLLLNNEGMIRVLKPVSFLEQLAPLLLLLAPAIPIPFVVRAYMRRGVAGQTVT